MKNVKLTKSLKAGFSLVEMLVVIAIIGIIAAIAIPNIGNINQAARDATAQRNAQQLASIYNAAVVAGAPAAGDKEAAVDSIATGTGLEVVGGPFNGKKFTVGSMPIQDRLDAEVFLTFQDGNLTYAAP